MSEKVAIYHFKMPSQYLLTSTFLRFQEFYESPKFRGRPFSLEEFQDWYATTRPHGRFSYYEDWVGFNFPSRVVDLFADQFSPLGNLSRKENWVLNQLWEVQGRYYVIGTFNDQAVSHEIVHGLFYLNDTYAERVTQIINEYDFYGFKAALRLAGYCEDVLVDEINAYLTTGLAPRVKSKSIESAKACRPRLLAAFEETFGINLRSPKQMKRFAQEALHLIDGGSIRDLWDQPQR